MLVTLKEIFTKYPGKCVAAFNVFGYEDAHAVISAAEELNDPVILMANKPAVEYMSIPVFASLILKMAERATVPVCVHLDHATELDAIEEAVRCGFTSVMFDGSQLPYEENVAITRKTCAIAHAAGVSVEAEIGSVGYTDPSIAAKNIFTEPEEAAQFYADTGLDAMAVSVGTVHRQVVQNAQLQLDRLDRIRAAVDVPLVIHGSSSVKDEELSVLAEHGVQKINLGTCLRLAFGNTLRQVINDNPNMFDRLDMFKLCIPTVREQAKLKMMLLDAKSVRL